MWQSIYVTGRSYDGESVWQTIHTTDRVTDTPCDGQSVADTLCDGQSVWRTLCDRHSMWRAVCVTDVLSDWWLFQSDILHQSVLELVHSEDRNMLAHQLNWNYSSNGLSDFSPLAGKLIIHQLCIMGLKTPVHQMLSHWPLNSISVLNSASQYECSLTCYRNHRLYPQVICHQIPLSSREHLWIHCKSSLPTVFPLLSAVRVRMWWYPFPANFDN